MCLTICQASIKMDKESQLRSRSMYQYDLDSIFFVIQAYGLTGLSCIYYEVQKQLNNRASLSRHHLVFGGILSCAKHTRSHFSFESWFPFLALNITLWRFLSIVDNISENPFLQGCRSWGFNKGLGQEDLGKLLQIELWHSKVHCGAQSFHLARN